MGKRECLKNVSIGQSATKPRTEEGSTTILEGSRGELVILSEAVSPAIAGEDIVCSCMKVQVFLCNKIILKKRKKAMVFLVSM